MKKAISFILATLMLIAFPLNAIGMDENIGTYHFCNQNITILDPVISFTDANTHATTTYKRYLCSICNEESAEPDKLLTVFSVHTIISRFNGTHYHIGNTQKHAAEYDNVCSECNHCFETIVSTYDCPGNGACLLP